MQGGDKETRDQEVLGGAKIMIWLLWVFLGQGYCSDVAGDRIKDGFLGCC